MNKVFILGSCRTPIGKMGGSLASLSAVELGSIVIKEAVTRAGIRPEQVEQVIMGCVIQAGLGQNIARQAAVQAGLPYETTAQTLNAVCGSGLESVNMAARLIALGEADIIVAGGTESMSNAPFAVMKGRFGYRLGYPAAKSELVDTMVNDALWDAFNHYHMGITAENLVKLYGLTRSELDEFSAESQRKACEAIESGAFKGEIVPITIRAKKGDSIIEKDEAPRPGTTPEALNKLKPAFDPEGIVTAGNASGINDGAAAVVLISERKLAQFGLYPEAEWIGGAMAGVDPAVMGLGSAASTRKLLAKLNMTIADVDLIEGNEAFAAQSIAVKRELNIPDEKLNVHGGAIALGHPVGASGCRILVTLLHAMKERKAKSGLAMLCIGGGMGCSTMIRSCEVN